MMPARRLLPITSVLLFASLWCGTGCRRALPWEKVQPVNGIVQLEGKPIAGAQVTLVPKDPQFPATIRPQAITGPDGRFDLGTFDKADGAPAGEYGVSVVWHPLVDKGSGPTRGDNVLPAKYSQPVTSGLTVTIETTGHQLPPLELKKR
jgi:hypothetical protein